MDVAMIPEMRRQKALKNRQEVFPLIEEGLAILSQPLPEQAIKANWDEQTQEYYRLLIARERDALQGQQQQPREYRRIPFLQLLETDEQDGWDWFLGFAARLEELRDEIYTNESPFAGVLPPDTNLPATFVVGPGVPGWELVAIKRGLRTAFTYFSETLRLLLWPIEVRIYGEDDDLPGIYAGSGNAERVVLRVMSSGWTAIHPGFREPRSHLQDMKQAVHEYFHTLQAQLSDAGIAPVPGPAWLVEGSAEYIGYHLLEMHHLVDHNVVRADWIGIVQRNAEPELPALEAWAILEARDVCYALSALAVELLMVGHEETALRVYFAGLRDGDWHQAFRAAFHEDPVAFYARFAQYRQNGL